MPQAAFFATVRTGTPLSSPSKPLSPTAALLHSRGEVAPASPAGKPLTAAWTKLSAPSNRFSAPVGCPRPDAEPPVETRPRHPKTIYTECKPGRVEPFSPVIQSLLGIEHLKDKEPSSQPPQPVSPLEAIHSPAGMSADMDWHRRLHAPGPLPVELEPRSDSQDSELPQLSTSEVLRFFMEEREQQVAQIPVLLASKLQELTAMCGAVAEQYTSWAAQKAGVVRARVLRGWIEKQRAHLCKPPASCATGAQLGTFERARAAVMLEASHVVSCTLTEQRKAAECVSELEQSHGESHQQLQSLTEEAVLRWAGDGKVGELTCNELESLATLLQKLEFSNAMRQERLENIRQHAELLASKQRIRAVRDRKSKLERHVQEARQHSAALAARMQELMEQVHSHDNDANDRDALLDS